MEVNRVVLKLIKVHFSFVIYMLKMLTKNKNFHFPKFQRKTCFFLKIILDKVCIFILKRYHIEIL